MGDPVEEIKAFEGELKQFLQNSKNSKLAKMYESGQFESLEYNIGQGKDVLYNSRDYLNSLEDSIRSLQRTMAAVSELMTRKLKNDFKANFGNGKIYTGNSTNKATISYQQQASDLAKQMKELEQLVAEIAKVASKIDKEIADAERKAQELQNQLAARQKQEAEEAKNRRNEEEERKRKAEEKRKKEEEENLRKEEEEKRKEEKRRQREEAAKRKREEDERRKREEEERVRLIQEEEEKKRKAEEERLRIQKEEEALIQKEIEERLRKERELEEQRRREEERRRLDEERKRKEDEERRLRLKREAEEEEKRRNNPENWPLKIFKMTDASEDIDGLARVRPDKMSLDDFEFSVEDPFGNMFPNNYGERAITDIIRLKSRTGNVVCTPSLHLSLPEKRDSKDALSAHWEIVVYEKTANGDIKELSAEMVSYDEIKGTKFIKVTLDEVDDSYFQAFIRVKTETWDVDNKKPNEIKPTVEKKVTLKIPEGSYPKCECIGTQICPVTKDDVDAIRSSTRRPFSSLVGSSPILKLDAHTPNRDLECEMPIIFYDKNVIGKPSKVYLMTSYSKGTWNSNPKHDIRVLGELARFHLLEEMSGHTKFLVLSTSGHVLSDTLEDMARSIERHKMETECSIIVKQHSENPNLVSISCTRRDDVPEKIDQLDQDGFTQGPAQSSEFYVRDGQVIEIQTKPNVKFDEKGPLRFKFMSLRDTANCKTSISVIDKSIQKQYSQYRGLLTLYTCTPGAENSYFVDKNDPEAMMCELQVALPKDEKILTKISKATFHIRDDGSPVTNEYFDEIKHQLSRDWRGLAHELGIAQSVASQAYNNHVNDDDRGAETVKDILVAWYKGMGTFENKVDPLVKAFKALSYNHLANDLLALNDVTKKK